jgi:Ser/Thr protein kinase RdoA (MazF antagonist)
MTEEDFSQWARMALTFYPLENPAVHFIGHSDNLTFRVEDGEAIYLLRLHKPVVPFYQGLRQVPQVIESELLWIKALAEAGFAVQRPMQTHFGDLVAAIEVAGGEKVTCTLLSWIEGRHFTPSAPGALEMIERFGTLVARMHEFAGGWTPPRVFTRPHYDTPHFQRVFARLLRGVDLGVFSEEVYRTLRATGQAIMDVIEGLPDDPANWGMIHADLHVGNFLVAEGQPAPIDFSFCGFGHYLFDLSVCLAGGLNASLRPAFMQGYRQVRAFPESDYRAVDAYVLAGRLSYYAYQVNNPSERAWLLRRLPEVAKGECSRFLEGETILWTV